MSSTVSRTVRASDLYDLAMCPHRLALDRALPRDARTPPDRAMSLLIEAGLALEARVAERLGYPRPDHPPRDLEAGARATLALMREGVPGIYQGVLREGRELAIPDLLERRDGASSFGAWHYVPGDVKAGFTPRADQVLQVAFAGHLLERVQGRAPSTGFLVLGDESREDFSLDLFAHVALAARNRALAIIDGEESTSPFYDDACHRCRWRGTCLPQLEASDDVSLIEGMTRTRKRVLASFGITRVAEVAELDPEAWRREGRPSLGLALLVPQARALHTRAIVAAHARRFDPPSLDRGFHLVHAERDPLALGQVGLIAWAHAEHPKARLARIAVQTALDDADRTRAALALIEALGTAPTPILHFGSTTAHLIEALCLRAAIDPARQVSIEERLCDLRGLLRRGGALLPVRRSEPEEVVAAITGAPLPPLESRGMPAFVFLANQRLGVEGSWSEALNTHGHAHLERLSTIARHVATATT